MSDCFITSVRFDDQPLTYCFYGSELKKGDAVVVNIDDNDYLGVVFAVRQLRENEDASVYAPIERIADDYDKKTYDQNSKHDLELIKTVQQEADQDGLKMKVFKVSSSLDGQKVKVLYTADDRVDFRMLVKDLHSIIHAHIDMHQVGPRDKAKMVGGLGICGLTLCCSTFLNSFDVISISMAKNQMLAINIPKLSGQCGKLICCLKYEDEAYAQAKKDFPRIGTGVKYLGQDMKVSGINVLSKTVTLISADHSFSTLSLEDFNLVLQGKTIVKKEEEVHITASSAFPSFTGNAMKDLPPVPVSVSSDNSRANNNSGNNNGQHPANGNDGRGNYRNERRFNNNGRDNNGNGHYNNNGQRHGNRHGHGHGGNNNNNRRFNNNNQGRNNGTNNPNGGRGN